MQYELDLRVKQTGDRNSIRTSAVEAFLKEEPGNGKGDLASRYRYNVEKLRDGSRVYVTRPAWLRVGFDFVVHLEGAVFANGQDNPAHEDIRQDLLKKLNRDRAKYTQLHEALCRVHECEDPEEILADCIGLSFGNGLSVEALLKIVKWFLIEQDIRYWNYSGRDMFRKEVIDRIGQNL